jgi:predicted transcriptional regulator
MGVKPAERDSKREQAFALALQKVPYREIAKRLGINKDTVVRYVAQERKRRSHDREAEDVIGEVVTSLRWVLNELCRRFDNIRRDGPHSEYARVKIAEQILRTARELTVTYGVKMPKIDGEEIAMDRLLKIVQKEIDAPLIGCPDVSEQAAYDKYMTEADAALERWQQQRRDRRRGIVDPETEERFRQRDLERDQLGELERRQREELEGRGLSLEDVLDSHDDHVEGF